MSVPVLTGRTLGAYRVIARLGAGGMGEVYRARDTRLQRDVALKIIAAGGAADPTRLARFEQEARATAALNHPHIVAVYDVGQGPNGPFIVSELLEGETLRDRLTRGPLPLRAALELGAQIARGLAAAHDKGIVHRDLKPENIFLTRDSTAKILDFGLAKLRDERPIDDSAPTAATMAARTEAGVVLGTVGYMAPEQVRGETADHRADLFALGCVLYEMVTGRRAFAGASPIETLHAILASDPPDFADAHTGAPPAGIQRLIAHALEKNPALRFQSARDLAFALDHLIDARATGPGGGTTIAGSTPREAAPGRKRTYLVLAAASLALIAAAALAGVNLSRAPAPAPVLRSYLFQEEQAAIAPALALSPDGTRLAFVAATEDGSPLLHLRVLHGLADQPLAGTRGATLPFWSPDSQHVAFFADGKLKRVSISGGEAQTLADAPAGRGGTWNQQGDIVFAPDRLGGLSRVAAAGGGAAAVTQTASAVESHRYPWFLPDGRRYLYMRSIANLSIGAMTEQEIRLADLDGGDTSVLMTSSDDSSVAYAAPGFLLFRRDGGVHAQAFDAAQARLHSQPVRLTESVTAELGSGAHFAVSQTGLLIYRESGPASTAYTLDWYARDGTRGATVGSPGEYRHLRLSPDGTRVAYVTHETGDVWVQDLARGARARVTFDGAQHSIPVWSPDGRRLAFTCRRSGSLDVHAKDVAGSSEEQVLVASDDLETPQAWSPDGRYVMYQRSSITQAATELWIVASDGREPPKGWLSGNFNRSAPEFSPDGRWVAYVSNESRRPEVYIAPFPGPGLAVMVSTAGGDEPRWRADGRELFFLSDRRVMSVDVERAGDSLQVGTPRHVLDVPPSALAGFYQPSRDGRRVLLRTGAERASAGAPRFVLLANWPAAMTPP